MHRLFSRAICAATLCALAPPAFAHAVLATREAEPNATYRAVVQITHGCNGSPTRTVRVTVPDGVIAARPMPKPGWTLATSKGPYGKGYSYHGATLAEGVKEITWSGGSLPDDQFDEFTFTARITEDIRPGATLRFPTVQECETGELRWVEIPAEGQDPHALKSPAPGVRIVAAAAAQAQAAAPAP
ncbi:MAG: hypothetical protein JWQ36_1424, partial [Enterovirga sp.]|nr:hypothetical protein [Enterovirga sp.]